MRGSSAPVAWPLGFATAPHDDGLGAGSIHRLAADQLGVASDPLENTPGVRYPAPNSRLAA